MSKPALFVAAAVVLLLPATGFADPAWNCVATGQYEQCYVSGQCVKLDQSAVMSNVSKDAASTLALNECGLRLETAVTSAAIWGAARVSRTCTIERCFQEDPGAAGGGSGVDKSPAKVLAECEPPLSLVCAWCDATTCDLVGRGPATAAECAESLQILTSLGETIEKIDPSARQPVIDGLCQDIAQGAQQSLGE